MFSLFSYLFVTERHRARAGKVGHALPYLSEVGVPDDSIEPLLATNMRGTFLSTRVSREGVAKFGFFECDYTQEIELLRELHKVIGAKGAELGWTNTAQSIPEGIQKMADFGLFPKTIVCPDKTGVEAHKDTNVLQADLLPGTALVVAAPIETGLYTRMRDYIGVLVYNADRTIIAVGS